MKNQSKKEPEWFLRLSKLYTKILKNKDVLCIQDNNPNENQISTYECECAAFINMNSNSSKCQNEIETIKAVNNRINNTNFIISKADNFTNNTKKSDKVFENAINLYLLLRISNKFSKENRRLIISPNDDLRLRLNKLKVGNSNYSSKIIKSISDMMVFHANSISKRGLQFNAWDKSQPNQYILMEKIFSPKKQGKFMPDNTISDQSHLVKFSLLSSGNECSLDELDITAIVVNSQNIVFFTSGTKVYKANSFDTRVFGLDIFDDGLIRFYHKGNALIFFKKFFKSEIAAAFNFCDFKTINSKLGKSKKSLTKVVKSYLKDKHIKAHQDDIRPTSAWVNLDGLFKYILENASFAKDFLDDARLSLSKVYVSGYYCEFLNTQKAQKYIKNLIINRFKFYYKIYLLKNGYSGKKKMFCELSGGAFDFDNFINSLEINA